MAAHLLQKAVPILRLRIPPRVSTVRFITWLSTFKPYHETQLHDKVKDTETEFTTSNISSSSSSSSSSSQLIDNLDNKKSEYRMYRDVEPTISVVKRILHSDRLKLSEERCFSAFLGYSDGEPLSAKDEKVVVEKLLRYHPRSEDKIGPGIDFIMVDRHPVHRQSRCLHVVHTDGGSIDFSYHMCLKAYLRDKYPAYAERFIRRHFIGKRLRMDI